MNIDISSVSSILISNESGWKKHFHDKLVFDTLTDEHVLRILFLQKIKKAKELNDVIKIYMDNIELDDIELHPKLKNILKYESDNYNIKILDINETVNLEEIQYYNKIVES
tara:strand:- start:123 stop:455 length:333 start_codon:yes stop_codon:yes gene_type:complete